MLHIKGLRAAGQECYLALVVGFQCETSSGDPNLSLKLIKWQESKSKEKNVLQKETGVASYLAFVFIFIHIFSLFITCI